MSHHLAYVLAVAMAGCAPAALDQGGVPFSTGLYDVSGSVNQTDCEGFIAPPGYDEPQVALDVATDGHVGVRVESLFGVLGFDLSPAAGYADDYPNAECDGLDHVHLELVSSTKDHVVFHEHESFDYDSSNGICAADHTGLTKGCSVDKTVMLDFVHACSNDPFRVTTDGAGREDCL